MKTAAFSQTQAIVFFAVDDVPGLDFLGIPLGKQFQQNIGFQSVKRSNFRLQLLSFLRRDFFAFAFDARSLLCQLSMYSQQATCARGTEIIDFILYDMIILVWIIPEKNIIFNKK